MDVEEKKSMNGSRGESEQGWIERRNYTKTDLEVKISKDGRRGKTEK